MTVAQLIFLLIAGLVALVMLRPLLFGGPRITALQAAAEIEAGRAVLIDVRSPDEWRGGVAGPAALLPLGDLRGARRQWAPFLAEHKDKTLILYCASGMRSGVAASLLRKEGYRVANLGAFTRWGQAGLPVK